MILRLAAFFVLASCAAQSGQIAPRQMPRNFASETPLYCAAFFGAEATTSKGRAARTAMERAAAFRAVSLAIYGNRPEVDGLISQFQSELAADLARPDHDINGDTTMMRRDCATFARTQPETRDLFAT